MKMTQIDDVVFIATGDHFMIIVGEKMYGKFHVKQLKYIRSLFEDKKGAK